MVPPAQFPFVQEYRQATVSRAPLSRRTGLERTLSWFYLKHFGHLSFARYFFVAKAITSFVHVWQFRAPAMYWSVPGYASTQYVGAPISRAASNTYLS